MPFSVIYGLSSKLSTPKLLSENTKTFSAFNPSILQLLAVLDVPTPNNTNHEQGSYKSTFHDFLAHLQRMEGKMEAKS
jgi:hypothetical protein